MQNLGCEFQPFVDGWKCGIPSHFMAIPWGIYGNKDKIRRWIWLLLAQSGQNAPGAAQQSRSLAPKPLRGIEQLSWAKDHGRKTNKKWIANGFMEEYYGNLWNTTSSTNDWHFFGGNRSVPQVLRRESPSRSFHPESPAGGACRRRPETMMNYMNYMNYQDPYGKGYIDPLIDLLYELSIHSPFPISAFHTSVVSIVNLRSISFLVALPIGAAGKGHSSESLQKSITKQSIRHDCTVDRGGHDQSHQPRPQSVAHDVNVMELNWHQQEPPTHIVNREDVGQVDAQRQSRGQ